MLLFINVKKSRFLKPAIHLSSNWRECKKMLTKREKWKVYRWQAFRKPSRRSFFSSRISPFSPDDRYFHKMSKRIIRQVSRRIKDYRNWWYCEKCIVIGFQSYEIIHEHAKTRENDKCLASFTLWFIGLVYIFNQWAFNCRVRVPRFPRWSLDC